MNPKSKDDELVQMISPLRHSMDPVKAAIPGAFKDCLKILAARGEDYDSVNIEAYMPFRLTSFVQMLHLKVMRAVSLAIKKDSGPAMEDTLIDLINYALFALAYLRIRRDGDGLCYHGGSTVKGGKEDGGNNE